jgi:hypothetical protein
MIKEDVVRTNIFFIQPVGTAGEFTALHDNTYTFFAVETPVGSVAQNLSYNIGTVAVNFLWKAT